MYIILRYIALTEIAEIDNIRYTLLYKLLANFKKAICKERILI